MMPPGNVPAHTPRFARRLTALLHILRNGLDAALPRWRLPARHGGLPLSYFTGVLPVWPFCAMLVLQLVLSYWFGLV